MHTSAPANDALAERPSAPPGAATPGAPPTRSRLWLGRAGPALLALAWVGALLAPILDPARALANRDILLFHLPLQVCFRALAASGLPEWNPWLNGGQPVLSNPSYSSFYPPTWLVLPFPPIYALTLSTVLHLLIAFAGAWYFARRLGTGRSAAALAAVAYAGSGGLLSLISAFNLLRGMCWIPWVLSFGAATLDAGERQGRRRAWVRPALLCGLALAIVMLNGEPSMVTLSGVGLLALACAELLRRRPKVAARILVPYVFAVALALVQLWPTAARISGTTRAHGLPPKEATHWSLAPARLVELVFPHYFGNASLNMNGLFFGHGVHDLDYPYVISLYPGLLVVVLAVAALLAWPIPRRAAWVLCIAASIFLAFGRNNPLYVPLRRVVPLLAAQRYPERFIVLGLLALVFAAALGWQRLLDERRRGRAAAADLPFALSLVVLLLASLLTAVLYFDPAVGVVFLRAHSLPDTTLTTLAGGLVYLRREGLWASGTAAATTVLFALCRLKRPPQTLLSALALLILAGALFRAGHTLVRTVPAVEYQRPPARLKELARPSSRIFVEEVHGHLVHLPATPRDRDIALARILTEGANPYCAAIWGVDYALNYDYDRMVTRWGSTILEVLRSEMHQQPEMGMRLLGAWAVDGMLLTPATAKGAPEPLHEKDEGWIEIPNTVIRNPYRLPLYRFVPTVSFHPDFDSALYASRGQGYAVDRHEHCVRAGQPAATLHFSAPPRLLDFHPFASRFDLRYRAFDGGFFVVASTFDDGWRASADGASLNVYETGAGQIGVQLPPGEHSLKIVYHDRLLLPAAAVSLSALALWAVLFLRAPPLAPLGMKER